MTGMATGAKDYRYKAVELGRSLCGCWDGLREKYDAVVMSGVDAMEIIGATCSFAAPDGIMMAAVVADGQRMHSIPSVWNEDCGRRWNIHNRVGYGAVAMRGWLQ